MSRFLLILATCAIVVPTAAAQFDVDGVNAALLLQETTPSVADPIDHDVEVTVPGLFEIEIQSGMNPQVGLILLSSPMDPTTGGVNPTPWGGSIDIGGPNFTGISVIGDGIGFSQGPLDGFFVTDDGFPPQAIPPKFQLAITANAGLAATRGALQAIVSDPTAGPLGLDNTEAVDANFVSGQKLVVNPTSTTSAQVPFLPGQVFNFHGVSYTEVFINANGYINFVNNTGVNSGGFTIDAVSFVNAEPAIAGFMADWENTTAPEGILYEESGNHARIAWGDPVAQPGGIRHFFGSDSNNFEIRLELQDVNGANPQDGEFTIDLITIDPTATQQNGDGLIGHTPGGGMIVGGAADIDLHGMQATSPGFAMIEEHNATGANASVLGYDGAGSQRAYNSIHSWNTQSVTFTPAPGFTIPGDAGYSSVGSALPPDDVTGTLPTGLDVAGGQMVTIIGKFYGFNDAMGNGGSVTFDPNGTPLTPLIVGILDSTGTVQPALPHNPAMSPFRDAEGLVIITPMFASTGTVDMKVDFNSGFSYTIPVSIVTGSQILTSYTLPNGGTVNHPLTNTIDYYGVQYTSLNICAHGYVTFASQVSDFSESMPEFFAGWQSPPTTTPEPGVAVIWSDLNRNNAQAVFEVVEDTLMNTTMVNFKNQTHWDTFNPAGDASVTFNALGPNSLTFDHSAFIPDSNPSGNTHSVIVGFTNGDDQSGPSTDLTNNMGTGILGVLGTYLSATAPDSVGERFNAGAALPPMPFTALDQGNGMSVPFGTWTIF